jgi:16S rRNA (cytosine1402-N4)-methyltransferase
MALKQSKKTSYHTPIMVKEVLDFLDIDPNGIYVDCTLGGGGHSYEIYKKLEHGKLISFDRDQDAINYVKKTYEFDPEKWILINEKFSSLEKELSKLNVSFVNGILLDLGVSSFQLDNAERGFSFQVSGPLDMRMNASEQVKAADLVNALYEKELIKLFTTFSEERYAKQIARGIIKYRKNKPITTTGELVNIIKYSVPIAYREGEKHFARRVFQALRMAINSEVEELREVLGQAFSVLQSTGRFVILCFHSLEQKPITDFMTSKAEEGLLEKLTTEPHKPSSVEINRNPRARSAKLLAYQKI